MVNPLPPTPLEVTQLLEMFAHDAAEAPRARPFTDLDDLKARVRGIGDSNLRRMREAGLAVGPSARVQTFTGQPAAARAKREAGRRSGPPDAARR